MLFKICPLTMRTQSILLVRDTVVILNIRPTESKDHFARSNVPLSIDNYALR